MTLLGNPGDAVNPATGQSDAFPACGGSCDTPLTPDSSHQPSLAYLAYLLFGDRAHLDELHFWTNWNLLESNPHYRDFASGLLHAGQIRGQAWSLRTLGYAAWVTPDAHPLKSYFLDKLDRNIADYLTAIPESDVLGINPTGYAFAYAERRGVAPWQDDSFTWAVGHLVSMGFESARPVLERKARFPIGRMTAPGYCWIFGAAYSLIVRDSPDAPLFGTFAEVYRANMDPRVAGLECATSDMAMALDLSVGEMTGYSTSPTGYPSSMQPALAVIAEHGVTGAAEAWEVFAARTVRPDYAREPQFAIVPMRP